MSESENAGSGPCTHDDTKVLRGFFGEPLAVKCNDCGVIA